MKNIVVGYYNEQGKFSSSATWQIDSGEEHFYSKRMLVDLNKGFSLSLQSTLSDSTAITMKDGVVHVQTVTKDLTGSTGTLTVSSQGEIVDGIVKTKLMGSDLLIDLLKDI